MPGPKTKTSFTLDRELFERAEDLSKQMNLSRSEFYALAIDGFVHALEERNLKDRINAAQAALSDDARAEGKVVADFLRRAATHALAQATGSESW